MDRLICDPELAPQLFKLVDDKLQETRRALEETKRDNELLRSELSRLQTVHPEPGAGELEIMSRRFTEALDTNRQLQGENADLRSLLEGFTGSTAVSAREREEPGRCNGDCLESRQAREDVARLEVQLAEAQSRLTEQSAAHHDLQKHAEGLQHALENRNAQHEDQLSRLEEQLSESTLKNGALVQSANVMQAQIKDYANREQELSRRLEECQQQRAAAIESDQTLRQERELYKMKYWRYKTAFEQLNARNQNAVKAIPTEAVAGPSSNSNMAKLGDQLPEKPWIDVINTALQNPCFSIASPHATTTLPADVKQYFAPGSTVLSCPNRIIVPDSDGYIRLLAPVSHCRSATQPLDLGEPLKNLEHMVGKTKEVFYHGPLGISYLGTFVGVSVGEVPRAGYISLPKDMKDAIVMNTFPSKTVFAAASKTDVNRLRNWYLAGKAKAQYLSLRYEGWNALLHDALKAHAAQKGLSPAAAALKRPFSEDEDEFDVYGGAKRKKVDLQL